VNQVRTNVPVIPEKLDLPLEISSQVIPEVLVDKQSQIRSKIKDMQSLIPANNVRIDVNE